MRDLLNRVVTTLLVALLVAIPEALARIRRRLARGKRPPGDGDGFGQAELFRPSVPDESEEGKREPP